MTRADYTAKDIAATLDRVGVTAGDRIFVHSNLGFFGTLEGAEDREDYCGTFCSTIREVLGEDGTLVVPTFTYSFCNGEPYDPHRTESVCGMFSEHVRRLPGAFRSRDANFSVAALGADARDLTADAPAHSFGPGSFWERFLEVGGTYCNLNFDAASTAVHYVERCLRVPYRWDKPFPGVLVERGTPKRRTFYHFVRDLDNPDHEPDFAAFDARASEDGLVRRADLGRGQVVAISARDTYDVIERAYLEDPAFLISGDTI